MIIGGKYRCFEFLNLIYSENNYKMKRKYDKFLKLKKIIDNEVNLKLEKEKNNLDLIEKKKKNENNIEKIIINYYKDGKSIRDINIILNIDRRKISKILKNNLIDIRYREYYSDKQKANHKKYYSK